MTNQKISETLSSFKSEVSAEFKEVRIQFKEMDKRFKEVDKKFNKIDKRFEQVDKRFEQVDKRFEQVGKRFDSIEGILAAHSRALMSIENTNKIYGDMYRNNVEKIKNLDDRVTILENV